jgi:uncharacterized protein YjgD (DUF1641 family)
VDRESAHEILTAKIEAAAEAEHQEELQAQKEKGKKAMTRSRSRREKSAIEEVMDSRAVRDISRTVTRELTRGLLGALGIKTTRRRSKSGWF